MHDLDGQAGSVRHNEDQEGQDSERRRRTVLAVLAVLLLLLLLCCIASLILGTVRRTTPPTARLIADNRECLQCHTELLLEFDMNSVHDPFSRRSCTICHTEHGDLFIRETTPGRLIVLERWGIIITLEPLAKLVRERCGTCGACGRLAGLGRREEPLGVSQVTTESVGRKPSVLTSPEPRLCYTCHRSIAQLASKKYQHNPFQKGNCTSACHRPHSSLYQKLLIQTPPNLCPSCHRLVEELALPDKHPPWERRLCVECHQPHASDFEGILQAQQKPLCFSCHPQVQTLTGLPVQHSPFINGQCTGCHRPHSSVARPLLIEGQPPLCYRCHPAIRNDFLKPSHHPVGTPLLNCSDCHTPHAAFYSRLLIAKDNNLCYTCHGEIRFFYERSAHNRLTLLAAPGLCINCHTPHGSVWAPLLIKEGMATCLTCHPTKISRADLESTVPRPVVSGEFDHNNHPVGDGWRDEVQGGRLTCYSTCHNPHGTGRRAMLKRLPDGLCLLCHEIRELD